MVSKVSIKIYNITEKRIESDTSDFVSNQIQILINQRCPHCVPALVDWMVGGGDDKNSDAGDASEHQKQKEILVSGTDNVILEGGPRELMQAGSIGVAPNITYYIALLSIS
jgi:hypothetical protein